MGRPTNKAELLAAAAGEFERLWSSVEHVSPADRERPGACAHWSVKDVLAHLHAWHEMLLGWERVGIAGGKPVMPAEGFAWSDIPALNAAIYERARHDDWDDVVSRLHASHAEVLALIDRYHDDDLFAKRRYSWTGSTSVGSYVVSASSSHYAWASALIRKWSKQRATTARERGV